MSATVNTNLETLCVNAIRFLAVDMVQKADSGHPGLPLDAAPMAYVLWQRFLKHNPLNPKWADRDRFVLSAGHGSALLYSLLYLTGYGVSMDQIQQFRQWGSITPGHPERGMTPGVEITTGPLGQGFANGVGMAMAEAHLAARFNRPDYELINHYTYGIVSDGDLMEGVASEAASYAGHLKLGKLIYLYDNNHITLSASTAMTFTEDVAKRFDAYDWHTHVINDGNDLAEIEAAIQEAQAETERPSLILVHTHIGYGSPHKQDTYEAHGSPLGPDEVKLTKENLNWPTEPAFYVPDDVLKQFRQAEDKGKQWESDWNQLWSYYEKAYPDLAAEFKQMINHELPAGWESALPQFPADAKGVATRNASGKVMNAIAPRIPQLMGGSADLNPSTISSLDNMGDFEPSSLSQDKMQGAVGGCWSYAGRNVAFGVREHAMSAIASGMAAHGGIIPYVATFFNFSDYLRPTLRLASMMKLQVVYIFTHDSIGLGEDGPTHQPVEQLASLRAIPELVVIRPADANETAIAWSVAITTQDRPTALILSRQKLPTLDRSQYASAEGLKQGAYILSDAPNGKPDIILIATGSEVQLIVEAQQKLREKGVEARLVSMPCWELFDMQPQAYRDSVLLPDVKARLSVEAGSPQGWYRYVGDAGDVIGVDHYGASGPGPEVLKHYGFSTENVCQRALTLIGKA